jgi:Uma2 family endonuclease
MRSMADPARALDERFTYGDYRKWPEGERWELIEGLPYSMSPAPFRRHQDITRKLFVKLAVFLEGHTCIPYCAPFDVLLPAGDESDDDVDTVIQPDIVVFCDRSKLTEKGARGAPDLIMEILSPSTSKKDLNEKFRLYEKHKVREYWVVDPGNKSVQVWRIDAAGRYDQGELRDSGSGLEPIASRVLDGFAVDPAELLKDLD